MRTFGFFLLWVAGAATAVVVAWAGVSVVDDDLVKPAPASNQVIAAVQPAVDGPLREAADPTPSGRGEAVAPSPALTEIAASSPTPDPTPAASVAARPTAAPTPGDSGAPATPAPTAVPPAPSPTAPPTGATPTPTPSPSPPTPTPDPTEAPVETITFNLVGGTTAISFSASGVEVLWATPNPGFEVRIEPESPGMKVEFRADHHRSRIDVWWQGGPRHEIREEPDD